MKQQLQAARVFHHTISEQSQLRASFRASAPLSSARLPARNRTTAKCAVAAADTWSPDLPGTYARDSTLSTPPSFPTGFLPNSSTSVTLKLCINAQRLRTSALHWAMPFRPPTSSRTQYRHCTMALVSRLVSAGAQPPSTVLRSSARPSTIHLRPAAGVP